MISMAPMQKRSKYRYRRHKLKKRGLRRALLKTGAGVLATAVLSILFIFCHDVITQHGFEPFRYDPYSRSLTPRDTPVTSENVI